MSEFELHLPTNYRLVDESGADVPMSQLTDADCHRLAAEFLEWILEQRDKARMH